MTDPLVQFLQARLAEDAAHAEKDIWAADNATTGNWRAHYGENLPYSIIKADDTTILRAESDQHQADVLLAARFKPETVRARAERMLAEVDAKRRILDLRDGIENAPWYDENDATMNGQISGLGFALQLLAVPYRGHPDYRAEWAPSNA